MPKIQEGYMNLLNKLKWSATVILLLAFTVSARADIVHRWNFNEASGTNIADSIGTANGFVVVIGTNTDFLRTNGAVRLAGGAKAQADYIQFPSGLLHSGGMTSSATIEIWATINAGQMWSRLFDFGAGNGSTAGTYFLSFNRNNTSVNQQRYEFNNPVSWTTDTGIATVTNVQYHYVATWSSTGGPSGGGSAKWYRDGVLITNIDTGVNTISNVTDTVLWLGRSQYNDPSASADFDEMRLYNFALTDSQISVNFSNGPSVLTLLPPAVSNDSITLNPGAKAQFNVLANDAGQSAALNPATLTVVTPPANGSALVKSNGNILYTHNGGPTTSDSFTYRVADTAGATSAVATVSITVSTNLRLLNTTMTISNTPPPVGYQVVDAFPGNLFFEDALALRSPPGSTNKLFVTERRGIVSYISNVTSANPTRTVMLDMTNQVAYDNTAQGEQGLLSMEFHPNFASNGYFYVFYMTRSNLSGNAFMDRVARFTANPTNFTVNTNSQLVLLDMLDSTVGFNNHNAGDMHFGLDGYLYISMGDEGDQYNASLNAQRLDKDMYAGILRIDVDKKPGNLTPTAHPYIPSNGLSPYYSIPSDNPFLGATTNVDGTPIDTNKLRGEFYAIGVRHPWRFSIDPVNGEVWMGIVGQDRYEEVDVVKKGGNYGWPYYEASHLTVPMYGGAPGHPGMLNPPPGFVKDGPLYEYPHTSVTDPATPDFRGLDVNGSLPYHGTRIPALSNAYLFGDFDAGGNIWALRRPTSNSVTVERLAGMTGIAAFGSDPSNGDPLFANYLQNKVQRLIVTNSTSSTFPAKLSDTGIFADLATLSPNPGIVSYSPNVAFWSDYAIKSRWFMIPDLTNTFGFSADNPWSLPIGAKWIKHFDLEMTRGNPATKKRIETRVLVKMTNGVFGVSYKWNDTQDEAFLVADGGDLFTLTITNNGVPTNQDWEIPSRSSCLACHTAPGGFALTFNTREMNKINPLNGVNGNQIQTMSSAGYFSAPVSNVTSMPAYAVGTDTNYSLEYRVRSYLAMNCVQCHQPTGPAPGSWDARAFLTLAQTGLINGSPLAGDGGNPANKLIVPGDTNHSILLLRIENNGFSRMPPLASHELDNASIQLVQNWIANELPTHLTYAQWLALYPGLVGPATNTTADPDGDGANNFFEYLTGTNPQNNTSKWQLSIVSTGGQAQVSYPQVPNVGVVIETSTDLLNWATWDVSGNQPIFGLSTTTKVLSGPLIGSPPYHFFRARLIQP